MIEAVFMFKGDAYIVFVNGDVYRIEPDSVTQFRIIRVTQLPWRG